MFGRAFPAQSASGTGRVHEGTSRVDDVSPTKQPLLDEVSYLPGLASVRSWWFLSYKSDEALPAPSKGGPGVQTLASVHTWSSTLLQLFPNKIPEARLHCAVRLVHVQLHHPRCVTGFLSLAEVA